MPASTALIPLSRPARSVGAEYPAERPRAEFLAQLIAMRAHAPQTRLRRRAEPQEAIAAYKRADGRPPTLGQALTRCL